MPANDNAGEYANVNPYAEKSEEIYKDLPTENPYAEKATDALKYDLSGLNTNIQIEPFDMSGLQGAMGNVDQQTQQAYMAASGYDPMAAYGQFRGMAPGMQQIAMGNYAPLTQGLNRQAARQAELGMGQMANQYADQGALHSGAARAAIAQAAMQPYMDVQNRQAQLQAGLAGNLMQQGLGEAFGAQRFRTEAGLQGAGLGMQGAGLQVEGARAGLSAQEAQRQMALQAAQLNNQALLDRAGMGTQQAGMYGQLGGQALEAEQAYAGALGNFYGDMTYEYQPTWWQEYGAPGVETLAGMAQFGIGAQAGNPELMSEGIGTAAGGASEMGGNPARRQAFY